ncbi:CoA pyrophosphatase [Idiomarina tyrosinivorans]|uniref:CoA pyrophosphatase n=1 Tax=Idiomarina tyrosinivorans TaxID=1445662 RepID=A0A432ZLI1_9GAMM|nr:CoA pyrophosphatase [Idiomarina tyrosinivorans]RUO78885.1 CoA pyrophosphatase [Idiomarina tyrosinivorans]
MDKATFLRRFLLHKAPAVQRPVDTKLAQRLRPAAVLIPIVERRDGLYLVLTKRSRHLRNHAGQISFPGGRYDSTDKNLLNTALRETEEEIGLPREQIEVIGQLQDYPVLSHFRIRPFVAFINPQQPFVAEPSEVAEIFEVSLQEVLRQHNHYAYRLQKFIYDRVYFIPYQQRNIWGATAGIIRELADHISPEHQRRNNWLN